MRDTHFDSILKKACRKYRKNNEGSFDQLIQEMYSTGIELKTQIGDRYIFNTTYLISENKKYLVQDQDDICTTRSTRRNIRILKKCLSLREVKEE